MADDGLLTYRVAELERHVQALEERLAAELLGRQAEERRRLMAGITFLGGVILSLGGIIWAYRSLIFQGKP